MQTPVQYKGTALYCGVSASELWLMKLFLPCFFYALYPQSLWPSRTVHAPWLMSCSPMTQETFSNLQRSVFTIRCTPKTYGTKLCTNMHFVHATTLGGAHSRSLLWLLFLLFERLATFNSQILNIHTHTYIHTLTLTLRQPHIQNGKQSSQLGLP